jgi:hypothetical protein
MIEETEYGYRLALPGGPPATAAAWLDELRRAVRPRGAPFSVLLDLRVSRVLQADIREILAEALAHCRETGMARTVQVLDSALTTLQAAGIARDAGLGDTVCVLDASLEPDWEQAALAWLHGASTPLPAPRP